MDAHMIAIGIKIKGLRQIQGLTQEDLAAKAGCSLATIQRAESGKRLSADSLASIAAAFNVSASELAANGATSLQPYLPLEPVARARLLVSLLFGSSRIDFEFCELDNLDDARAIEAFHDFCHALVALERPLSPIALATRELEAREHLAALAERDFRVGGAEFEITAYEVDDDCGTGLAVLFGQWDMRCVALRVGRSADDISRAHVLRGLGQWETPKGDAVIYPSTKQSAWDGAELPDSLTPGERKA